MRNLITMLLILGICASLCAFAHSPPVQDHDLAKYQIEKMNPVVAENQQAILYQDNQILSSRLQVFGEIPFAAKAEVSKSRLTRNLTVFQSDHWRIDRSRYRWQKMTYYS